MSTQKAVNKICGTLEAHHRANKDLATEVLELNNKVTQLKALNAKQGVINAKLIDNLNLMLIVVNSLELRVSSLDNKQEENK